ncbi:plasmid mobilization relaxosome protein MobC [Marinovum sp.]|uniref:plasmid mobilization relaxosome protein MobC n=1 Tax=Marinovum sp. TaxID=2024839 RepID=UPI002B277541|nr:plasmid mobilization relaxosome protein MobC [Marinovum sp.]
MKRRRRLSEIDRSNIVRERRDGVSVACLASRYGVSLKTIYNTLNHAEARQVANGSRSQVVGIRVSESDLRRFDAALSRRGLKHRSDAMRKLMLAAEGVFLPDDEMCDELRNLGAALNRVGNNVNQIARRLNEAKLRGERLPWSETSHRDIRTLAGLVFDMADQIQEMSRARRSALDLEIESVLSGLGETDDHGAG